METREEIESMRVVDLREFLRRYGHPMKSVMRESGTPGPMRKSELLEAALEIYEDRVEGKPSPARPSPSARSSVPNPFQSGITTPPGASPSGSSSVTDQRHQPKPIPQVTTPTPKKESKTPAKSRRRSAAWVDPVLLAQMRATTPTKAVDTPTRTRPIAPRPSFGEPTQLPSRPVMVPSPARPPQRIERLSAPKAPQSRPPQRVPMHVDSSARKPAPMSRMPLTPRRLAVQKPKHEPRSREIEPPPRRDVQKTDKVQVTEDLQEIQDVPVPSLPTHEPVYQPIHFPDRRRLVVDFDDDDYVSDEDPDYDADAEEGDQDAFDYPAFDEDAYYAPTSSQAGRASRYMNTTFDAGPSTVQEPINVDIDDQEDIPIDSDHYREDFVTDSDPGSAVEPENGDHRRKFVDWSTSDIKAWLHNHNVRFRPEARRDVLISVACAHALHLEATAPVREEELGQHDFEEDRIAPSRRAAASTRRRRVITAPHPDDEDGDIIEIEPAPAPAIPVRMSGTPRRGFVYDRKTARAEPLRRRPVFVLLPLLALFLFLCSSGFLAISVLQKHLTMTYCDTHSTLAFRDDGMECRPCPRNGHCSDGSLQCDPGYVELRGRCVEDKEFNLLSERVAYSAFQLMSELAGRAECGEDVPRAVSPAELASAIKSLYAHRRHSIDARKFEDAMAKAIMTLQTDDAFDVRVDKHGLLSSNVPKLSVSCRMRRKLWEYKRAFLIAIGVLLLIVYVRVKRFFHERHERRLNEAHASALEYLRDQVNGYRNNEEDVAFVPDVVIREEVVGRPTTENKKFWKEVEERLNRDARVIRKHQVLKGMPSYTFEYVGSRRGSGGRNSGTFFDSLRRSSFGSRASLDSYDFVQEGNGNGVQQKTFVDFVGGLFSRNMQ